MARRTTYAPGTPCAVDLVTPDIPAAKDFYRRVFGWQADEEQDGYTAFRHHGALVAGAMALTEEMLAAGVRPAWVQYVAVADLDAAAARVAELGGSLTGEPFDVPGAGRGVGIADPQGATLSLWQAGGLAGAEEVNAVGAWSWSDLQTADPFAAVPFYEALFGWQITEIPGAGGAYWSIALAGRAIAGVMQAPPGTEGASWNVYFGVDSTGAALEHVDVAGGERVAGPFDVPSGRFAVALDPLSAPFSVVEGQYDD
jgi:predicted enzyme related to lactoylglutathione lyase